MRASKLVPTVSGIVLVLIASAPLLFVESTELSYEWISYNPASDRIPADAISAGYDLDGNLIYVSQMRIGREKIPSQMIPAKANSYAVHDGDVYKSPITAIPTPILCGKNYAWVSASLNSFPINGIPCGKTENGDILYVGRAEYNGSMIVGAVAQSHSALFAAFNGTEVQWFGTYKVLVFTDIDQWKRATFDDFPEDAVLGGHDKEKRDIYVGIIRMGNQVIPAQINPEAMLATGSYPGGIEQSEDFQVLTGGHYQWVSVKKGKLPENAVIAGRTAKGEGMHFGRVMYKRLLVPGTVLASDKVLYMNYLGKLRTVESTYEVLVRAKGKI